MPRVEIKTKLVVVGNHFVGKSSLCSRLFGAPRSSALIVETAVDFFSSETKTRLDDIELVIHWLVWTLTGEQRTDRVEPLLVAGADTVVVMFAVDDRNSFDSVTSWVEAVFKHIPKKVPIVLIGNKVDLRGKKPGCVTKEEGARLAEELSSRYGVPCLYCETSVETGEGLDDVMKSLVTLVVWNRLRG